MKKLISLFTTICIVLGMFTTFPVFADDSADITEISTLAELEAFRDDVNSGNTYEGKTVKLTDDIDLGGIDFWGDRVEAKKWTPIGNYSDSEKYFDGTFDGNGHTISGIYINSSEDFQGLFGFNSGTVKNLHIDGEVISTGNYVGGIAGMNCGTIENCYNTGSTKNRDENGKSAEPYGSYIGGIAGAVSEGTIKNCYATGRVGDPGFPQSVSGLGANIGGIAGAVSDGTIENCYKTGYSRAGELATKTSVRGAANVGGIVGSASESSTIQGCFYLEKTVIIGVSAQSVDGGNSSAVTKAQMRNLPSLADWDFDNLWEMNPLLCRPVLKALPEHTVQGHGNEQDPYLIPDLKTLDIFRDYINMDYNLGNGEYFKLTNNIDMSKEYGTKTPVSNEAYGIDAGRSWTPAGFSSKVSFKGTFDGDSHSLTGFYINKAAEVNQGLFGFNEGTIKNLDISGFLVGASDSGTVAGVNQAIGIIDNCHAAANINILPDYKPSSERLGGISGQNDGKILNSTHSGNILTASIAGGIAGFGSGTISGCSHSGNVEVIGSSARTDYAGGIAGYITNGGSIKDCQNSGNVNLKYNHSSSGSNRNDYAGGIVGYIEGSVENSYNTGNVEFDAVMGGVAGYVNGTVKNCYSSNGNIKSNGYITGGVVGHLADGKIETCYNTSALSSGTHDGNGGIVGRLEKGEVINCLSTSSSIAGDENVGGIIGYALGGSVKNCCFYTRDEIKANKSRAIIGYNNDNSATAENCYFYGASDSISGAVKKSFADFKNGSVAYLLNGSTSEDELVWYQNIGTDMYPVLDDTHLVVIYDGEKYYNAEPHIHSLTHHTAAAATCTETGTGEYWACEGLDGCNKMFLDASGLTEIADVPTITATGHSYGSWSISEEPTDYVPGYAERICQNDNEHKDFAFLPVLTDTTVWTEDLKIEPTETEDGSQVYTSEYGNVTIIIPALGHTHNWGEWSIVTAPKFTETGIAERICTENENHKDTFILPILTNNTVWKKDLKIEPTETENGLIIYTSQYGTVNVIVPALNPNYDYGIKYENGKAVVTVPQDGTYTVIFAAYNNDRLLRVDMQDIQLAKGENSPISPQNFNANGKVKVMLWDSLMGMKPLCAADGQ